MRAIPDVSYDADPASGFSVYWSSSVRKGAWYVVGGTSAGAPQWAAIESLGLSVTIKNFIPTKHKRIIPIISVISLPVQMVLVPIIAPRESIMITLQDLAVR